MISCEHELPVSIPAALPVLFAGLGIDARENRLVEAINMPLVEHRARELVFHPLAFPDRFRLAALALACPERSRAGQLEYGRAVPVRRGHENTISAVVRKHDRLRDVDAVEGAPWILPQQRAFVGRDAGHTSR